MLSGADAFRGLFVYSGKTTIENLTIENAVAQGGAGGLGAAAAAGRGARRRPVRRRQSGRRRGPGQCHARQRFLHRRLGDRRRRRGQPGTSAVWAAGAVSAAPADLGLAAAPAAAASASATSAAAARRPAAAAQRQRRTDSWRAGGGRGGESNLAGGGGGGGGGPAAAAAAAAVAAALAVAIRRRRRLRRRRRAAATRPAASAASAAAAAAAARRRRFRRRRRRGGGFGGAGFGGGNGGGDGGGGGGGGLGAGGDIFVMAGASLTIEGGGLSGGSVAAGAGANGGADGASLRLRDFPARDRDHHLRAGQGTTEQVFDVIADQTGSGGAGANAGAGRLTLDGAGTLDLIAANTYTGGTTIEKGVLELANAEAAGRGANPFRVDQRRGRIRRGRASRQQDQRLPWHGQNRLLAGRLCCGRPRGRQFRKRLDQDVGGRDGRDVQGERNLYVGQLQGRQGCFRPRSSHPRRHDRSRRKRARYRQPSRHSRRLRTGVRRAVLGAGEQPVCVRFLVRARVGRRDRPRRFRLPISDGYDDGERAPGALALAGTARSVVTGLALGRNAGGLGFSTWRTAGPTMRREAAACRRPFRWGGNVQTGPVRSVRGRNSPLRTPRTLSGPGSAVRLRPLRSLVCLAMK